MSVLLLLLLRLAPPGDMGLIFFLPRYLPELPLPLLSFWLWPLRSRDEADSYFSYPLLRMSRVRLVFLSCTVEASESLWKFLEEVRT